MGEYCGRLWAGDDDLSDEHTQYIFSVNIGPILPKRRKDITVWIDAERVGTVFRFMNHSCDPNVKITDIKYGMKTSILAVETIKDIAAGEELTISYNRNGSISWFEADGKACLCGTAICKNLPVNKSMTLDDSATASDEVPSGEDVQEDLRPVDDHDSEMKDDFSSADKASSEGDDPPEDDQVSEMEQDFSSDDEASSDGDAFSSEEEDEFAAHPPTKRSRDDPSSSGDETADQRPAKRARYAQTPNSDEERDKLEELSRFIKRRLAAS